jgi:hypothetical protein
MLLIQVLFQDAYTAIPIYGREMVDLTGFIQPLWEDVQLQDIDGQDFSGCTLG